MRKSRGIDPGILLQLNKVISLLNPRYALSVDNFLSSQPPPVPDTCGEDFKGTRYGYPFFEKGFEVSPSCKMDKKPSLNKLLTVLIFNRRVEVETLGNILNGIKTYNTDLPVFLATNSTKQSIWDTIENFSNIHLFDITQEELNHPGIVWNRLIKEIRTPYTLIAADIFYFNSFARLERQIFVISNTTVVGVAGGAFRNESGHWKVGCHVSRIKNFVLKYTEGYQHSAMDCMFCDYLEGPFIAKTSVLKNFPLNEQLPHNVLFKDWFLRVKQSHILVMNCPDVMYFKRGPVEEISTPESKLSWLELAREWQIVEISYPPKITFSFTCKELKIKCNEASVWVKTKILPSCCFEQIQGAVKYLDTFAKEHKIDYELEAGSLLGAVKLRHYLPWDVDGDITVLIKDLKLFNDSQMLFANQGYKLSNFEKHRYFKLNTPDFYFEMWGEKNLSTSFLPSSMQDKPTLVKFTGVWVRGEWNPGLFARNRYGPNYLKHVQHWSQIGSVNSWVIYKAGSWKSCPNNHHACLDQYPTDGSIGLLPEDLHL
ncbi:uncharacterized protein [Anabrus simplex]